MLAYEDYLMNSIDAGMRMCAGEFGLKIQKTSKNAPRYKCPITHGRAQGPKGPIWQPHKRRRTSPCAMPHQQSEANSSRPIRHKREDPWAHMQQLN